MRKRKLIKKERIKKILGEYIEVFVFLSLILIVMVLIFIQRPLVGKAHTVIESEHITADLNLPDTVYVGEEFIVVIDLSVTNISNGVLVAVDIPEELKINSINPNYGLISKESIIWTLSPNDNHRLSINLEANSPDEYRINIKYGTYDNINDSSEEENISIKLIILQCESNQKCDDNQPSTDDYCLNNKCVNVPIEGYCNSSEDCDDGDSCTNNSCLNNRCQSIPKNCDDYDVCTTDSCLLGQCRHIAITNCCSSTKPCDDNNPATEDICVNNACTFTPIENYCESTVDCQDQVCKMKSCVSNTCQYSQIDDCISCTSDDQCNDGNECTNDICDTLGVCQYTNNDLPCSDTDLCNGIGTCNNGICTGMSTDDPACYGGGECSDPCSPDCYDACACNPTYPGCQ